MKNTYRYINIFALKDEIIVISRDEYSIKEETTKNQTY